MTKDGLSVRNRQMSAIATLQAEPPREFIGRAVRVADHWRQVDPDPTAAYQAAARILSELGAAEMAWEYLTTPLAARHGPCLSSGFTKLTRSPVLVAAARWRSSARIIHLNQKIGIAPSRELLYF